MKFMIYQSKSHENDLLNIFLALFVKNQIFDYLEVDLLTLKMPLNHENNIRNGFTSQNYTKKGITFVLTFIC